MLLKIWNSWRLSNGRATSWYRRSGTAVPMTGRAWSHVTTGTPICPISAIHCCFCSPVGSARTPGGAWMISDPSRPRNASARMRTIAKRIEARKCHRPSSAASTRSMNDRPAMASACAATGGSGRGPPWWALSVALLQAQRRPEGRKPAERVGEHQHAEEHEQPARDHRDGVVVAADELEAPGDPGRTQRDRQERERETRGIRDEEHGPL